MSSIELAPLAALEAAAPFGSSSEAQKQYVQALLAGAVQRAPFAGHPPGGALANEPGVGVPNLAAHEPEEPTFCGTPVSELCAEEVWKHERNPLDCWDDLLAHAAENSNPETEFRYRFKYYGLFHVAPAQDSFMLRLRVPGGVLLSDQRRDLIRIAEQWGRARIDLTTRANIQNREIKPKDIVNVLNGVQHLGMRSHGSGADNIRNITASPIGGYDPQEVIDVQPFADSLQNYISKDSSAA